MNKNNNICDFQVLFIVEVHQDDQVYAKMSQKQILFVDIMTCKMVLIAYYNKCIHDNGFSMQFI